MATNASALGHAEYFAELIDEWAPEGHADERLYRLGSSVIDAIADGAPTSGWRATSSSGCCGCRASIRIYGEPGSVGSWRQITGDGPPARRITHEMAYDADRGRVVLFGGSGANSNAAFPETWDTTASRGSASRPQARRAACTAPVQRAVRGDGRRRSSGRGHRRMYRASGTGATWRSGTAETVSRTGGRLEARALALARWSSRAGRLRA